MYKDNRIAKYKGSSRVLRCYCFVLPIWRTLSDLRVHIMQMTDTPKWPMRAGGAREEGKIRMLRQKALLGLPGFKSSHQKLDDWVRHRWGSGPYLSLGLNDLLNEQNDVISRSVFEMMANEANSPSWVFLQYRQLKAMQPRAIRGWGLGNVKPTFGHEVRNLDQDSDDESLWHGGVCLDSTEDSHEVSEASDYTSDSGTSQADQTGSMSIERRPNSFLYSFITKWIAKSSMK